jgi:hypothetical protein
MRQDFIRQSAAPKTLDVIFKSKLPALMREQLEAVFFFNPRQSQWATEIRRVVERYGVPAIESVGGEITLALRGHDTTQTLFAVNPKQPNVLEGVIIYGRFHYPEILILHLALAGLRPASALVAQGAGTGLNFVGFIEVFSNLVRTVAGVERLRFAYWDLAIPLS